MFTTAPLIAGRRWIIRARIPVSRIGRCVGPDATIWIRTSLASAAPKARGSESHVWPCRTGPLAGLVSYADAADAGNTQPPPP